MRRAVLTLCLGALLTACGTSADASSVQVVDLPTRTAVSATPAPSIAALPTATTSAAAAVAPATSTYSGARWRNVPTPGVITPHQEQGNRYAAFVAGTQQSVADLYNAAYRADGWAEESRATVDAAQLFTYRKGTQRIIVAFGPDLGTNQVVLVIEETS